MAIEDGTAALQQQREAVGRGELLRANARIAGSPFIGRAAELAALGAALDDAARGRGRAVALTGEAGIGKTRLMLEAAEQAVARGFGVIWGRCHDTVGAPAYWPWIQVLRACARPAAAAGDAVPSDPAAVVLAELMPGLGAGARAGEALDVDAARFRLFDGVAASLKAAARCQPLLILLDSLHWADKSTLSLLQFVGRELGDARALVVASYRDDEVPPGHPLFDALVHLRREPAFERLVLRGLAHDEVHAQLAAIAGRNPPRAFVHSIVQRSDGNPFCVQEILRCLVEEGVVFFDGTGWTSALHPEQMAMPDSIRAAINRRLAHISADGRSILSHAAVIGREFGCDTVRSLAALPGQRLEAALGELVDMRVLVHVDGSSATYRFAHALIRETLYDALPHAVRARLHQRVGNALERGYGAAADGHAAELAHHFAQGGEPQRALSYALRAAEQAGAQRAHEEAARHYAAALVALDAAAPADDARRVELLLASSYALWRCGEFEAARRVAAQAAALARRHGWAAQLARAALAFAGRLAGFGAVVCDAHVVALLEEALLALGDGETATHAALMARLAEELTFADERERRRLLARQAIDLARRLGDPAVVAAVLQSLHWALWAPERVDQRLALAQQILPPAESAGDRALAFDAYLFRCFARLELGDRRAARAELAACVRLAAEMRQPYARWLAECAGVCLAFADGRLDLVESRLQDCLQVGEAAENPNVALFHGVQRAHLHWLRGGFDEVHALADGLAQAFPLLIMSVRCAQAVTFSEQGRRAEAREAFESIARPGFAAIPRNVTWLMNVSYLAQVCAVLGDARRAVELYDLLRPFAGRTVLLAPVLPFGAADHYLGLLAATFGRWDHAGRHFENAMALNARLGTRQWLARTQIAYAELLAAHGAAAHAAPARCLAEEAQATAVALTLPSVAARADALLAELAAVPSRSPLLGRAGVGEGSSAAEQPSIFRREGEYWTVAHRGTVIRLKDCRGLHYLAHLLRHPGCECHVLDLVATANGHGAARVVQGGVGPALDERARAELRERWKDLRAQLAEAEQWNDCGRVGHLCAEIESIERHVRAAHGLGGRPRAAGLPAEQARQTVTKGIASARRRIAQDHPVLGEHLDARVKTGFLCVYLPDRERPMAWVFD